MASFNNFVNFCFRDLDERTNQEASMARDISRLKTKIDDLKEDLSSSKEHVSSLTKALGDSPSGNAHLGRVTTSPRAVMSHPALQADLVNERLQNNQLMGQNQRLQEQLLEAETIRRRLAYELHECRPLVTIARLRPALPQELKKPSFITHPLGHDGQGGTLEINIDSRDPVRCTFDKVYDQETTNDHLWRYDIAQVVEDVLRGDRVTVFVYGASNTGKTHTIQGTGDEKGIIEHACVSLLQQTPEKEVTASVIEVKSGKIHDLGTKGRPELEVSASQTHQYQLRPKKQANAPSSIFMPFRSKDIQNVIFYFKDAWARQERRDMTKLKGSVQGSNQQSSRGHTISTLRIGEGSVAFVDIAGHEKTPTDENVRPETISIAKNISGLFDALVSQQDYSSKVNSQPKMTSWRGFGELAGCLYPMIAVGLPNTRKPRIVFICNFASQDVTHCQTQKYVFSYIKQLQERLGK